MKTSAVLASMLFGSLAVAAPFDKRALVTKTAVVTETVVVYTTVFDDEVVPQATTTPAGYFYEQPKSPSPAPAKPTSAAAPPAPPAPKSSSVYVAPPQAPAPTPSPAPVVEQPKPVVESPKPVEQPQPSPVYQAPAAPASPSPSLAAPVTPSKPSTGSGETGQYAGDITIYEPNGNTGACGTNLSNEDMVVALSIEAFGASTYDKMTGAATNKWCGQQINVFYQGRTVSAKIMDMCPGCKGDDIDLSPAAWKALTGSDEKTRYKATWSSA